MECFVDEGVDELLRDKTRGRCNAPMFSDTMQHVPSLTVREPADDATHWRARMTVDALGFSTASAHRIWMILFMQARERPGE